MSDGGKGDKRRPEDTQAFEDGFARIFGDRSPQRGKFIWDDKDKKFVPEAEFYSQSPSTHYVMGDIQPYQSMVTGERVESRSRHREILREHRMVEIGTETQHLKLKPRELAPGRKEMLSALADSKLRYR